MVNFIKNNYEFLPFVSTIAARGLLAGKICVFASRVFCGSRDSSPIFDSFAQKIDKTSLFRIILMEIPVLGNGVIYLINKYSKQESGDENLGSLLSEFAEFNNVGGLQALLSQGKKSTYSDVYHSITIAAKNGQVDLVKKLLEFVSHNKSDEEKLRGSAVEAAVENGHLNVIEALLSNNEPIDRLSRISAIKTAVGKGFLSALQALLQKDADEKIRGEAIYAAAKIGRRDVIEAIISQNESIDKNLRKRAIAEAAEKGFIDIVNLLLLGLSKADDLDLRSKAFEEASYKGHTELVRSLVENDRPIRATSMQDSLNCAAKQNNIELIQVIMEAELEEHSNGYQIIVDAAKIAAEKGHLECLREILKGVDLSDEEQKDIAFLGAKNAKVPVVEAYFKTGDVIPAPIFKHRTIKDSKTLAERLITANGGKSTLKIEGTETPIVDLFELTPEEKAEIVKKYPL